jgi:hypothetical protein
MSLGPYDLSQLIQLGLALPLFHCFACISSNSHSTFFARLVAWLDVLANELLQLSVFDFAGMVWVHVFHEPIGKLIL